jgi:hypothetical protein
MKLQDGAGGQHWLKINDENMAMVASVERSKEHHANVTHGDAYNFLFSTTPGAGKTFLYLKNTGEEDIVCEGFSIRVPSNEQISIHLAKSGTPVGGSNVVPANLNAGSSKQARGVFQTGTDITGLSGGREVMKFYVAASDESNFRNFDADIVIPKNLTMTMHCVNGSILLDGFIVMWHEHNAEA